MNAAAAAAAAAAITTVANSKGAPAAQPINDSANVACVNGRSNGEVKSVAEPKATAANDVAPPVNDVRVIYTNVNHFDSANNRLTDATQQRDRTISECSTRALTDDAHSDRFSVHSDKSACHDTTDNTNNNKTLKNANIDEDIVVLRRPPTSPKDSLKVFIALFYLLAFSVCFRLCWPIRECGNLGFSATFN